MRKKTKLNLTTDARAATKAVVRLRITGYMDQNVHTILDPRFSMPDEWTGSGFFIRVAGRSGYVLTNCHVACNATHIEIQSILTSDESFRMKVVGLVEGMEPDVALLCFEKGERERFIKTSSEKRIPYLKFGDSTKIRRGEEVKAIGYPLGMNEPNISGGEISNFISGTDTTTEKLVTDAPINPGNSGGPALTRGGKVIGINTSIIAGANNIGFITPIHLAKNVLHKLAEGHPAGICSIASTVQKNSPTNAKHLKMKNAEGVICCRIYQGGLAARMGLRPHDVILSINGIKIDRHGNVLGETLTRKRNLYDVLHGIAIGKPVVIKLARKGQFVTLKGNSMTFAGDGFPSHPVILKRTYLTFGGLIIQEICTEIGNALASVGLDREVAYREFFKGGSTLVVTHIDDQSPAVDMSISLGDFLVKIQGKSVKNLTQLKRALTQALKQNAESIVLDFSSGALANFPKELVKTETIAIQKFGKPTKT